jgi:aspartate-semialdehyde dehydrogenase
MSSFERESQKIVIAGASSLLGAELKSLLEEGKFAGWDMRLVDEVVAGGTLTEVGGEPAVIQPIEVDSFEHARIVFFSGSAEFTQTNLKAALDSGGKVVDLSGMMADREASSPWFPELPGKGLDFSTKSKLFSVLSATAVSSSLLSLALKSLGLKRLSVTHFQSVSEAGRAGIDEMEMQTSQLLSFQPVGKSVFDEQVAYSMLNRYGPESKLDLKRKLEGIRSQVVQALGSFGPMPALTLLHAPIFYGAAFSAYAEIDASVSSEKILSTCGAAGFDISQAEEPLGNLSPAGQEKILIAKPENDPAQPGAWWLWGAADNVRLPAWNAVKLAEKLVP